MLAYPFGPVVFDAPGGEVTIVELKLPAVGYIRAIRLNQPGGVLAGGTFRIFQSREAAEDVAGSLSSSSLLGTDPDDYSVVGVKTIVNGAYFEVGEDCNYSYANQDANQSSRKRRLWMVIQPGGSGAKSWSLSMQIGEPVMVTGR